MDDSDSACDFPLDFNRNYASIFTFFQVIQCSQLFVESGQF